jgi:hypothetical protein
MKTSQTVGIAVAAALVGSTVTLVLMHGVASSASATHTSGTVLVKEVFGTTTSGMTTGTVSHATRLKGWFVMDCRGCHVPAQSTNWIYVDGYPVLRH